MNTSTLTMIIKLLDGFTESVGKSASYFSIIMVLVTCYVVVTRYIFNTGSIAIQESVIYLNALLFLVTCAYTLKHNGHVRVDIFYSAAGARYKAWVNFLGSIFLLLPVAGFLLWACWDYVMASWAVKEQSGDTGGLPFVYLLKTLILVMGFMIIIQGIAEILRNAQFLFFEKSKSATLLNEDEGSAL